jgi:hypothetical protein
VHRRISLDEMQLISGTRRKRQHDKMACSSKPSPKVKRGARKRRVEDERERDADWDVILRAPDIS